MVPMWVEFSSLSLPLWSYQLQLCVPLDEFIYYKIDYFYASCMQKQFCVKVDLVKYLKEYVDLQVDDHHF